MITELWTVFGVSDELLRDDYVKHETDVEVPDDEARGGVKYVAVTVHGYGDTVPPNAYLEVTATTRERAVEVWHNVARQLNLAAWWTHREVVVVDEDTTAVLPVKRVESI